MAARLSAPARFDTPQGEVGEIYTKSPIGNVTYYRNDEATKKSYRDGFFTVGDLGYFDEEGYLYLADRATDMIISGGINIYPVEIEEVLHHHPAVTDAAVFGIPDERWGESVKAVVVLKDGERASTDILIAHCKEQLASFKIPRSIDFTEELPRNPSGKILKKELRNTYWGEGKIKI